MSSAITEMTDVARDLSARVRSLEALNRELEARLELLETHEPRPPPPQAVPGEPRTEADEDEEVETEQLLTSDADDSVQERDVGRKQKQALQPEQQQQQKQQLQSQQNQQKSHKPHQQRPEGPSPSKGDRRLMTIYIRKIPANIQLKVIQQRLGRQLGKALNDLRITQTVPSAEFRGRWKFVKCEGPSSTLVQGSKACEERKLPWKVSHNPPSPPQPPFYRGPQPIETER